MRTRQGVGQTGHKTEIQLLCAIYVKALPSASNIILYLNSDKSTFQQNVMSKIFFFSYFLHVISFFGDFYTPLYQV